MFFFRPSVAPCYFSFLLFSFAGVLLWCTVLDMQQQLVILSVFECKNVRMKFAVRKESANAVQCFEMCDLIYISILKKVMNFVVIP